MDGVAADENTGVPEQTGVEKTVNIIDPGGPTGVFTPEIVAVSFADPPTGTVEGLTEVMIPSVTVSVSVGVPQVVATGLSFGSPLKLAIQK